MKVTGAPYIRCMSQVNVSLPGDLSAWADARVAEGRFGNPGEYLRDLIRRDCADEAMRQWLLAVIDEGLASPEVDTTIEDIIVERLSEYPELGEAYGDRLGVRRHTAGSTACTIAMTRTSSASSGCCTRCAM